MLSDQRQYPRQEDRLEHPNVLVDNREESKEGLPYLELSNPPFTNIQRSNCWRQYKSSRQNWIPNDPPSASRYGPSLEKDILLIHSSRSSVCEAVPVTKSHILTIAWSEAEARSLPFRENTIRSPHEPRGSAMPHPLLRSTV
jgi:hypothetical protein